MPFDCSFVYNNTAGKTIDFYIDIKLYNTSTLSCIIIASELNLDEILE